MKMHLAIILVPAVLGSIGVAVINKQEMHIKNLYKENDSLKTVVKKVEVEKNMAEKTVKIYEKEVYEFSSVEETFPCTIVEIMEVQNDMPPHNKNYDRIYVTECGVPFYSGKRYSVGDTIRFDQPLKHR